MVIPYEPLGFFTGQFGLLYKCDPPTSTIYSCNNLVIALVTAWWPPFKGYCRVKEDSSRIGSSMGGIWIDVRYVYNLCNLGIIIIKLMRFGKVSIPRKFTKEGCT